MSKTTYEAYKVWDEQRRLKHPTAKHWIYKSKVEEFTVAEWCPLSGVSSIYGT